MNKFARQWSLGAYFLIIISQIAAYDTILQQTCNIMDIENSDEKKCDCSNFEFLLSSSNNNNNFIITCSSQVLLTSTTLKQVLDLCNYTMPWKLNELLIRRCAVGNLSFVQPFLQNNESSVYKISTDNFQNIGSTAELSDIQILMLKSVRHFCIRNSNLNTLPESIFQYMTNLTTFSMYNCSISTLSGDLFKPVMHLDELLLQRNKLTSLESKLFRFVSNLKHLNLSHNHLQELPVGIFDNLTNLTMLDLSNNKLKRLEAGIFHCLQNLKHLYLNDNQFDELPGGLFSNTFNLINITMTNACTDKMVKLPAGFFANLRSLVKVHLDSNHFTELPADLFQNCTRLDTISFENNALIQLPNTLFRDTLQLERLDLSYNKLQNANSSSDDYAIPSDLFQNCKNLKYFNLAKNALNALSSSTFKNTTLLTILDLSDNQIQFLNDTIFQSVTNLKRLKLARNHLETIDEKLFTGLRSLEKLNLSHNRLKNFKEAVCQNLNFLEELDLSHNQLTLNKSTSIMERVRKRENKSPFHACEKLKTLNLRNNSLRTIFHDWKQLKELKELDLSLNQFQSLTSQDLFFKKRCDKIYINLNSNNITSIKLNDFLNELRRLDNTLDQQPSCEETNPSSPHDVFFSLKNNSIICDCDTFYAAKYLQNGTLLSNDIRFDLDLCSGPDSMRSHNLKDIPLQDITCPFNSTMMKCPENCTCMERPANESITVNCTGANLQKFPNNFLNLSNVTLELEFANNNLDSINELSNLSSTVKVTKLSLSFNKLRNIDTPKLPNGLKVLELDNNQLSNLNDSVITQLNSSETLTTISLHNNAWQCNCESQRFIEFIRWIVMNKKIEISVKKNVICYENGEPIMHVLHHNFCETFFQKVRPYAFIVAFILLIIIFFIIYRIYKYQIKVWMFSHPLFSWLVTEKEIDKTKKYDAFISYSTKDESFVVQQLIPKLEENDDHRFKLCIHYRDFPVGEYIPNQIINAVEDSRRTIFLLSPNFLESVWTRMEFRVAHLKTIKERHARVIIILLDEIRTDNLDPELKTYITMHTYLKWGDPRFWEKLRYALPHPKTRTKR